MALIDRTLGTNIGDLTGTGGLAAAFDGVTTQAAAACATKFSDQRAYVGKTLAAAVKFARATIYGASDTGFCGGVNPSVTINIRGKQGAAPSSGTNGTIIGTLTFTDTADESAGRIITSTDIATEWDHLWAELSTASSANWRVAELVLERVSPSARVVFIA